MDSKHLAILEESARVSQDVAPPDAPAPLRGKLLAGIRQLSAGLLERETEASPAKRSHWR